MRHFVKRSSGRRPSARGIVPGAALAVAVLLAGCGAPVEIDDASPDPLTQPAQGTWSTLIFVAIDCPISNHYAPEIRRICAAYESAGVQCTLVYSAPQLRHDDVQAHLASFNPGLRAVIDSDRALVARAGANVTPQAVVFTSGGKLAYSGRIDNLYTALGRPRQSATEHDLRNALDDLIAGRPVRTPRTQAIGCYIE
jgi:hypothetical protein